MDETNPNFSLDSHQWESRALKKKYTFFPSLAFYSGPTATLDKTTTALFGINFENLFADYEQFRLGFAIANTSDSFLTLSHKFQLYPKTWGTPYWLVNMNFGLDSKDPFGSFTNMRNFMLSLSYGAKLNRNWSLEASAGLLSLNGISFSLSSIYTLSF
jgi:hypothetical protein